MTALMNEVVVATQDLLSPREVRALILMGGYGRGEGGVVVSEGKGRPHNNLDFLLIGNDLRDSAQEHLMRQFRERVAPLIRKYDVQIELSGTTARKLVHAPSLVMWYDMRYGHKTIWGDERFVASLRRFEADRIPAWDIRNLLVNRGTALVTNDQFIAMNMLDADARRLIVKQAMKAIIGYGDALLFFLGDYHWSYLEKQRRMQVRKDVAPEFRALYDEAVEFRFLPDYARYADRDLAAWMAELWQHLEPLHRACEARRLGMPRLDWKDYPDRALRNEWLADAGSLRAWIKKGINVLRSSPYPGTGSGMARLGYRVLARRQVFPLIFPIVAYRLEDVTLRQFAARVLGAESSALPALRRAYLRLWSDVGDPGFAYILGQWPALLEPGCGEP